ncbi:tRNA dihydrouridine synthase DusB [soil metagenome]
MPCLMQHSAAPPSRDTRRDLLIGDVVVPGRVWIAPMTGVSDLAFRKVAVRCGAAYVATEMVACADFSRGRPDVVRRAAVGEGLPLTVIQLVGAEPTHILAGATLAERAGADIVDLNFGCPAKSVTGAACGSALMRDLDRAQRIIEAAVAATSRPVTVKMRLGWDEASLSAVELAQRAEASGAQAITVHGRTRKQQYSGTADWRAVAAVKAAVSVPVLVNGDITDVASARAALVQSGADGVMLGRGVYGRPWLAAQLEAALNGSGGRAEPQGEGRLGVVLDHMAESLNLYGDALGLRVFRKHLGWYVEQGPGPADPAQRRSERSRLCRLETAAEVERALRTLWLNAPEQSLAA